MNFSFLLSLSAATPPLGAAALGQESSTTIENGTAVACGRDGPVFLSCVPVMDLFAFSRALPD
jgi:hypothetical protein